MSTKTSKVYVPKASAKEISFDGGGSLIRLGFRVEELLDFIHQHATPSGYLNLTLGKRRDVGKFGETHSVYLDTYTPKAGGQPRGGQAHDDNMPF